jgi:hypothetical protein
MAPTSFLSAGSRVFEPRGGGGVGGGGGGGAAVLLGIADARISATVEELLRASASSHRKSKSMRSAGNPPTHPHHA